MLNQINYNPDVLDCLSNLSNDEVFTSPKLVNELLDNLPQELFKDKETTFLDPVTKTGVFLREITKRLIKGLEEEIPNIDDRINHILKNQVFGIAITELTSILSRRSVYCSKIANGKYSICKNFETEEGNIIFSKIEHTWDDDGKCEYCRANRSTYDRNDELETYAYQFIHTENIKEIFDMKFDVIVGNPPYQMSTAGNDNSAQALPIYHLFVEQAIKLNPRYLSMIIPSRWFAGGWGLKKFRENMISDTHIKTLHDFPKASDCFPGVEIKGGVCYFLRDKSYDGKTEFTTHENNKITSIRSRFLQEPDCEILIRYNDSIPILKKVRALNEKTFDEIVSTKKPFGFLTNYHGAKKPFNEAIKLYGYRRIEYVKRDDVRRRIDSVYQHKLIIPKAVGSGDSKTDHIKPLYSEPNSCCTETYLMSGPFTSKKECENAMSYIDTKFFHFLVTLQKNTQDCMKKVYSFVPIQDFSKSWTDKQLYSKYGLDKNEIDCIESMIRPEESK
jgi:hypothetical protein